MRRLALAFSLLSVVACSAAPATDATGGDDPADLAGGAAANGDPSAANGDPSAPRGDGTAKSGAPAPPTGAAPVLESGSGASEQHLSDEASAAAPITKQDWMARTPGLAGKALNKIFMPATHDSGTYGIQSVYSRPVDDAFAPDGKLPIIRAGQFIGVSDKWARSQEKNIGEQLRDGIRAIDLRPCREKSGALRVCHGMYGPLMSDILEQVRVFAVSHPKEIIIVSNAAFSGMGDADHDKLAALYSEKLGANLLDHGAGDVSPASSLGDLWAMHPGKNVIVTYDNDRRPATFWPDSTITGSWNGDVWDRTTKKADLEKALGTTTESTFFSFSGAATPDSTLITNALDPLGTYPLGLAAMADETNPVMLGWLRDTWSTKAANLLYIDFYNRTCLFELTQHMNGNAAASLDGCAIGTKTSWGNWRLGYERFGYGRGVGSPMGCSANEEQRGALCYPKCNAGYTSPTLFPYLCATACPAGYRDDGLTCFRDASIISSNNSKCAWYDKCGIALDKGCSVCPSGYSNDGCTCRRDPNMITKTTYTRGAGVPLHACGAGEEKDGLLCYPTCAANFHGVGPMCMPND